MVRAQWPALLYWPRAEFMYLVLTTSTGEAMTVVRSREGRVKWQGEVVCQEGGVGASGLLLIIQKEMIEVTMVSWF